MSDTFTLVFASNIYGVPKAQPRPRAFARNGKARMYDPGTSEAWKGDVARDTKEIHGLGLEGPLKVALTFLFERPKSHYKSDGQSYKSNAPKTYYTKKPDADNLAKAVLDALTVMGVWKDDSQVVILEVTKRWVISFASQGCHISILTIDEHEY
jgi:Holliday junction resolvase RusA-like endonuclease